MQNATLFNPIDDSLEAKVKIVREVQRSYQNIKASIELSKRNGFNQSLGTEDELKDAFKITQSSYKQAVKSLSSGELKQAREKQLLTVEEFQKISVEKHKSKVQTIRGDQKNKSYSKDHSHRK